mgnify:CR=1
MMFFEYFKSFLLWVIIMIVVFLDNDNNKLIISSVFLESSDDVGSSTKSTFGFEIKDRARASLCF